MKTKYKSGEAETILAYYAKGHTQAETMERFGITKNQLEYLAKRYKVKNGRTTSEIAKTNGANGWQKAADKTKADAGRRLTKKINELGFEIVGAFEDMSTSITIKCVRCGSSKEVTPRHIRNRGTTCEVCRRNAKEAEQKAKREKREQQAKANREAKEAEHLRRLNAPHICKRCGKTYTIADYMKSVGTRYERNSGYCSRVCRDQAKAENDRRNRKKYRSEGKRHRCKHYTRAKELGLPAEEGITLEKLIARDGTTCAICGLQTFYGGDCRSELYPSIDHIIPLAKGGGHTWSNVQVAHRLCNSNKRDLIGTEWNNTRKG